MPIRRGYFPQKYKGEKPNGKTFAEQFYFSFLCISVCSVFFLLFCTRFLAPIRQSTEIGSVEDSNPFASLRAVRCVCACKECITLGGRRLYHIQTRANNFFKCRHMYATRYTLIPCYLRAPPPPPKKFDGLF